MDSLVIRNNIFDEFPEPNDVDSFKEYQEFIYPILGNRVNRYFEHSDCHHILPRCLGGMDEGNLIYLTYREHFLAHYYLAKAYFFNDKVVFTAVMMGSSNKGITKEEKADYYEYSRKLYIDIQREKMTSDANPMKDPEICKKWLKNNPIVIEKFINMLHTNNPMTNEESRKKVAKSKEGKIWVNNGINQTYVDKDDLQDYLNSGYSLGMLKRSGKTRKDYDCHCRICNRDYKGGKYSSICRECYSEMKRIKLN